MRRRSPAAKGSLLLALALLLACHRPAKDEDEEKRTTKAPKREEGVVQLATEAIAAAHVETAVVSERSGLVRRHATGSVEPDAQRTQDVKATAGGRVVDVRVRPGDRVHEGDVLASLASAESADAWGKLTSAQSRARLAQASLRRAEALAPLGAIAGKDLASARAEAEQADAEVEQARASLRALGAVDARASAIGITAPASGTVTKRFVNAGEAVDAGAPLVTVSDLTRVWAVAHVPESFVSAVVAGTPVEVRSTSAEAPIARGSVGYVDPMLDPEMRAARARVELPNPDGRWKIGMFVEVTFELPGSGREIVVPEEALQRIGERSVVFTPIEGTPGAFRLRDVQAGERVEAGRVIVAGLRAGERVVTRGAFTVKTELLKAELEAD